MHMMLRMLHLRHCPDVAASVLLLVNMGLASSVRLIEASVLKSFSFNAWTSKDALKDDGDT